MNTTRKEIRGIDISVLEIIENYAKENNITSNQLIKEVITDFAKRIQEVDSSKILHAQIDDLIEANNRLIRTQNENTLAMGEIAKTIVERLDYYLPPIDTNEIQKARLKGKNDVYNFDLD